MFYVDNNGVSHPGPEFDSNKERIVSDDKGQALRQRKRKATLLDRFHLFTDRCRYYNGQDPQAKIVRFSVDEFGTSHPETSLPGLFTLMKNGMRALREVGVEAAALNVEVWEDVCTSSLPSKR